MILPGTGRGTGEAGGGGGRQMLRPEVALARGLRRTMTYPEVQLWSALRGNALGIRFRRQHPIGPYVVDFYAAASRLVVGIDGAIHGFDDKEASDRIRDRYLNENGYRVLRVAAADVQRDAATVVAMIAASAARPLHHALHGPPPRSGED